MRRLAAPFVVILPLSLPKDGSALSIDIFMPLFSMSYMSMGANLGPPSQHGRNKIFKIRPL
jgi:hypothetical protein